jgi:uncharacterized protein (AIM24 family)
MSNGVTGSVNCDAPIKRACGGQPCIMSVYNGNGNDYIGLSPAIPAKIIPIDTKTMGLMRFKSGGYLAHYGNVDLNFDFDCCSMTCCFGGQGCVRPSVSGDGTAFLQAMGTVLQKDLADGETLVVDTHSVLAWSGSAELGVKCVGGCCTVCFGGEGCFNTTLTGPGKAYVQSYSKEKFAAAIRSMVPPPKNGGAKGAAMAAAGAGAPPDAEQMVR